MITNFIARKKDHLEFLLSAFMVLTGYLLLVDGLRVQAFAQYATISDTTAYDQRLDIEENRSHRKRFHPLARVS